MENRKEILNRIVVDVMRHNWLYDECCKTVYNTTLRKDLVQEICMIILETKTDGLITSYANKQHKIYIKRIFKNMFFSQTSPCHSKYRKMNTVEYDEWMDDPTYYDTDSYND